MIKKFVEYQTKNNIYFHHSISYNDTQGELLQYPPETHSRYELFYLISGTVQYKIEGEVIHIEPGDLVIINQYELHSLIIDPQDGYERIVLQFPSNVVPIFSNIDISKAFTDSLTYRHVIPKKITNLFPIKEFLLECRDICSKNDNYTDVTLTSKILKLHVEIDKAYNKMHSTLNEQVNTTTHRLIKQSTKLIRSNLNKILTAEDIAADLHISTSHLHHLFKKEMGIGLHKYMLIQKMQLAIVYFNEGLLPNEVSNKLGYSHYTSFYSAFKNFFGYSPNQHGINNMLIGVDVTITDR